MNEDLQKLHTEMMDKYFDEGWSQGYLCAKYKRTPQMIYKMVKLEEAKGRKRTKTGGSPDRRRRESRRPLSQMHWLIGVRIANYRAKTEQTMGEFGLTVGLSRVRVGEMESGFYDPTILELTAIAKELDMTLIELMTERPVARQQLR